MPDSLTPPTGSQARLKGPTPGLGVSTKSLAKAPAHVVEALVSLAQVPEIAEACEMARASCTELRWHQALRKRIPEAAAESRVRGAWASAELEGARSSVDVLRDVMRGARERSPQPDPAERIVHGAMDVTAASEQIGGVLLQTPAQALARLHLAATAGHLDAEQAGRPRHIYESVDELTELPPPVSGNVVRQRVQGVYDLIAAAGTPGIPALLVISLVHAELIAVRPFVAGNGLVARAVDRALVVALGLDPTGVAVPEWGHGHGGLAPYLGALTAYTEGSPEGVALWVTHAGTAMRAAASEGAQIADAVLAGYLTTPEAPSS